MSIQREEHPISWGEYFMEVAKLTAKRSKDPNTQVGACIVNSENKIIGVGYNGFVSIPNNDNIFPWTKDPDHYDKDKYSYVVHAEANALLNCTASTKGATIYVTLYPCRECTKLLIQAGIKEIVYLDYREDLATALMVKSANIKIRSYKRKEKGAY